MATGMPPRGMATTDPGYLPVYEDIPADIVKKATAMFLNYPNNPTGA